MSKIMITADDMCNMFPSVFNRECALYITDGTIEKDRGAYRLYRTFFDANPSRHVHIFQTVWHQFDQVRDVSLYAQVPYHYVKVSQLSPGIYECYQCYFGREFAQHTADAKSDTDIAHILLQMQLRKGMGDEMEAFIAQVRRNSQKFIEAEPATSSMKVN